MNGKKLIFGDPDSIAYKKKFEEDLEKKEAVSVEVTETEIEKDPEYEYGWKCPHCGLEEDYVHEEELPFDNIIRCAECKKWLKLKI